MRVIRRLTREHVVEPFSILFSNTVAANVYVFAGTPLLTAFISVVTIRYVRVAMWKCLSPRQWSRECGY
jgi:hypothetical protein